MNTRCLDSLFASEQWTDGELEVLLMESNRNATYQYDARVRIMIPEEKFGFHRFFNTGLDNTSGENITLNGTKLGDKNDVLGTLAHEGYPGHLYAYVYSKELGLSNLATVMTSTAHGEGWATYVSLQSLFHLKHILPHQLFIFI